jgi:hypothetical protein
MLASGSNSNNINLLPAPPAPIVDQRGVPVPAFWRFLLSLVGLAGGNASLTLEELEAYVLGLPEASPTGISNLQGDLEKLRAVMVVSPEVSPAMVSALVSAVEKLTALVASLPSPKTDLFDRVSRLEALVLGGMLTP